MVSKCFKQCWGSHQWSIRMPLVKPRANLTEKWAVQGWQGKHYMNIWFLGHKFKWFIPKKQQGRNGKKHCCVGCLLKGLSKLDKFSFTLLYLTRSSSKQTDCSGEQCLPHVIIDVCFHNDADKIWLIKLHIYQKIRMIKPPLKVVENWTQNLVLLAHSLWCLFSQLQTPAAIELQVLQRRKVLRLE